MNLDIIPNGAIKRVHVSQNDVGRTLTFELFNNSTSYSVPSGATVKIQGTKPSGLGFSETCTVSGNTATIDTTEAMTDESGNIATELSIQYDDVVIGTSNFVLAVERNPHPSNTTDGTQITAQSLQVQINQLRDEIEGGIETDTTLSISGMAADAKTVGDIIGDVEEVAETLNVTTNMTNGKMVNSVVGSAINIETASNPWTYTWFNVTAGEKYDIKTYVYSQEAYWLWFVDSNGIVVAKDMHESATGTNHQISASVIVPSNAVKMYIQSYVATTYFSEWVFCDKVSYYDIETQLANGLSEVENKIAVKVPINIIDLNDVTDNKFIAASSGALISNNDYMASGFVELPEKFVCDIGTAQFVYYDSTKTRVSGVAINTLTTETEYTRPDGVVYARFSYQKSVGNGFAVYDSTLQNKQIYVYLQNVEITKTIYVGSDDNADYEYLKDGIAEAIKYKNSTVYVGDGTYNLIDEFGSSFFENMGASSNGIMLQNGVHVIFSSKSKVVCNYTGSNDNVKSYFSPFNSLTKWKVSGWQNDGFILENLTLECSNVRYGVHDEHGGADVPYKNVYRNCNIKTDNSNNSAWTKANCIGGGLGQAGEIIIENCVFDSAPTSTESDKVPAVSYHNTNAFGYTGKSNIVVTGNYFKGTNNGFRAGKVGSNPDVTTCLYTNNLAQVDPWVIVEVSGATDNMEIIAYNNTIES